MTSKPYFDSIQVRSALLRLIEKTHEEDPASLPDEALSMRAFYRNPAPVGEEYMANEEIINAESFVSEYSKLENLLLVKLPKARSEKTAAKYAKEALDTAVVLWQAFYSVEKVSEGNYVVRTRKITTN